MAHAFDNIRQGLTDAIAHAKSQKKDVGVKLYQPQVVDVSSLRERLSLIQRGFTGFAQRD